MLHFTANYAYTNSNFVVQNLPEPTHSGPRVYDSLFAVLKNILQRGAIAELAGGHTGTPTRLSLNLADKLGDITQRTDFKKSLFCISTQAPSWKRTIKGDDSRRYYPAREFFEALPSLLEEYGFVQQLICPEVSIHTICPKAGSDFTHQQVDFYCSPAKIIIEVDGWHHKGIIKIKDENRDTYFAEQGILTVRIDTQDWRDKTPTFWDAITQIKHRLEEKEMPLRGYKRWYEQQKTDDFSDDAIIYKLLPTAVMRFQLVVLELLIRQQLKLTDKHWHIVVQDTDGLSQKSDAYARFASMAVMDLFLWLEPLCRLMNITFNQPELLPIVPTLERVHQAGAIHVDFSLLQRYTDEHELYPETLYVRTDYFSATQEVDGKNYFRVATTNPITYNLTNTGRTEETLRFFLQNLFDKHDFREGQLPIILNALNRKDTIGLLPTGGGKSLCYQLPCLLQPAVSLVVCPIKSLMSDQKDNLDKAFITRTNYITGELEPEVKEAIQSQFADKRYFFVWISPERFQTKTFRRYLTELNAKTPVAYAVVDEVHCMSEWGHDFRTSYLNLTKTIHEFCPQANLIGLTATASHNVLRNIRIEFARGEEPFNDEDVKTKLNFSRPELQFQVIDDGGKKADTLKLILKTLHDSGDFLHQNSTHKAGLVFTPHVNWEFGCYQQSNAINAIFTGQANWFSGECPTKNEYVRISDVALTNPSVFQKQVKATLGDRLEEYAIRDIYAKRESYVLRNERYPRAGFKTLGIKKVPIMSAESFEAHKNQVQKDYKENKFPLMVATKAFGMGIDKQNIHYTFHYGMPGSTESLYQEAGRAGRWDRRKEEHTNKQAICRILFSSETIDKTELEDLFKIETSLGRIEQITDLPEDGPHKSGDLLRQFFLFKNGYDHIDAELDIMQKLMAYVLTQPKAPSVNILWSRTRGEFAREEEAGEEFFKRLLGISENRRKTVTEKALYRLSLLGIVQNWTTDFVCHFAVQFTVLSEEEVLQHLICHLVKYTRNDADDSTLLSERIRQTAGNTLLEQCMRFLLAWTWETIAYTRRTSLKTLYDLCRSFNRENADASQSFRQTLDNYFRVDEITIIFQYIADQPKQYTEWVKAFQRKNGAFVQSTDDWKARSENLSRFVESNKENLGINAISGILRLALNDYEHANGRSRLKLTLSQLRDYFSPDEQTRVLRTIVQITKGLRLPDAARYKLADSIEQFYPESGSGPTVLKQVSL